MGVQRYNFLRILKATALTSLVCFSSSAVYAMDGEDSDYDASLRRTHRTTDSNERSKIHSVIPRLSFAFPDLSNLILLPDPAIFEALSQTGKTQMVTFKRLMDKGASFSERLNVAAVVARYLDNKETALSLVGRLFLDKRISHSERLEVGALAERIGKDQGIFLFSKLIERADFPFSYRLRIARSLGERALFKLATDERNKLEDRVSAAQYLEGTRKIIADRMMQRLLEGMSNKDPSISALRGITLPEGYNSNEWSKIHCKITMPERLLLKFETHQSNKPKDRVSFTEYLEDLHLDEYLLLNF